MTRKKRWRVYSLTESGNPLLVDSFDLREQAQRCIDRLNGLYGEMPNEVRLRRPRFALEDAMEGTMEGTK